MIICWCTPIIIIMAVDTGYCNHIIPIILWFLAPAFLGLYVERINEYLEIVMKIYDVITW